MKWSKTVLSHVVCFFCKYKWYCYCRCEVYQAAMSMCGDLALMYSSGTRAVFIFRAKLAFSRIWNFPSSSCVLYCNRPSYLLPIMIALSSLHEMSKRWVEYWKQGDSPLLMSTNTFSECNLLRTHEQVMSLVYRMLSIIWCTALFRPCGQRRLFGLCVFINCSYSVLQVSAYLHISGEWRCWSTS